MPTPAQLGLLIAAIALFAAGGIVSIARLWRDDVKMRVIARALLVAGIIASAGVLVWHAVSQGKWLPIGDNFDALVWLGTLLALFVLYVQRHRALGSLDWFVMPVVILLLTAAAVFGRTEFREYHPVVRDTWAWVHRVTAYGGAVAFAIAGAAGGMYVLASRRLRSKRTVGPQYGSLERLEHLTMTAVTLGFALLTVGMITGGVKMIADGSHTSTTKIVLAVIVWLVYAVVLHAPINPSFRGRKVAWLSVFGFVLMLGTILAVLFTGGGNSGGNGGGSGAGEVPVPSPQPPIGSSTTSLPTP